MRASAPLRIAVLSLLVTGCPADDPDDTDLPEGDIALQRVADGFVSPLAVIHDGVDDHFVVDQIGAIHRLGDDSAWLDLSDRIVELDPAYDERGLLGLAFDPDYEDNGHLYVHYSAPLRDGAPSGWNHTAHLSRFTVDAQGEVDLGSELILMQIDQPQANHNGGTVRFGPDGMLYLALGDGGGAADVGEGHPEHGNGQDVTTLLGSILRIDVSDGTVRIPSDNPFAGMPARGASEMAPRAEIWAWGFRNPYKMSFDRQTGDLIVGDVGQNLYEEINVVQGGENYGWNIKEGTICFDRDNPPVPLDSCPSTGLMGQELVDPVLTYPNIGTLEPTSNGVFGRAVIAGHVYRGTELTDRQGWYFFGDFTQDPNGAAGAVFVADPGNAWSAMRLDLPELDDLSVRGFGESGAGELYVTAAPGLGVQGTGGVVFRLVLED